MAGCRQVDQVLWSYMASLGHNDLTHWPLVTPCDVIYLDQHWWGKWLGAATSNVEYHGWGPVAFARGTFWTNYSIYESLIWHIYNYIRIFQEPITYTKFTSDFSAKSRGITLVTSVVTDACNERWTEKCTLRRYHSSISYLFQDYQPMGCV